MILRDCLLLVFLFFLPSCLYISFCGHFLHTLQKWNIFFWQSRLILVLPYSFQVFLALVNSKKYLIESPACRTSIIKCLMQLNCGELTENIQTQIMLLSLWRLVESDSRCYFARAVAVLFLCCLFFQSSICTCVVKDTCSLRRTGSLEYQSLPVEMVVFLLVSQKSASSSQTCSRWVACSSPHLS